MTHPGILLVDYHVQSTHNKHVESLFALVPPVLIIASGRLSLLGKIPSIPTIQTPVVRYQFGNTTTTD